MIIRCLGGVYDGEEFTVADAPGPWPVFGEGSVVVYEEVSREGEVVTVVPVG